MAATKGSLYSLLYGKIFAVPDYQRPYEWEEVQVEDLRKDVEWAIRNNRLNYYLGPIVLVKREGELYYITDGQQRITTVLLWLSTIMLHLEKKLVLEPNTSASATKFRLEKVLFANSKPSIWQLQAPSNVQRCWTQLLNSIKNGSQMDPLPEELVPERLLRMAFNYNFSWCSRMTVTELASLGEYLLDQTEVLQYQINSMEEAAIMFESINNRGLSLSALDKVKANLIFVATRLKNNDLQTLINDSWAIIMKAISHVPVDELNVLSQHWKCCIEDINVRDLEAKFELHILRQRFSIENTVLSSKLPQEISRYTSSLVKFFQIHTAFPSSKQYSGSIAYECANNELKNEISNLWKSAQSSFTKREDFIHSLLAAVHVNSQEYNWMELLEYLKISVKFIFHSFLLNSEVKQARKGKLQLWALCKYIATADTPQPSSRLKSALSWLSLQICSQKNFDSYFADHYTAPNGIIYFFYEYEKHLRQSKLDFDNFTVEHVFPQHLAKTEDNSLRVKHGLPNDVKINPVVMCIGNLCLATLSENASYGDKIYSEKRGSLKSDGACYLNSQMLSLRKLAETYPTWNMENLAKRQSELRKWASVFFNLGEPVEHPAL